MSRSVRVTKVFSNEREIVVGVDGSEYSKNALKWAVSEAKLRDAVLRLVCVAPAGSDVDFDWTVGNSLKEFQEKIDEAVEAAEECDPTVVVRGEVLIGPVAKMLIGVSEVSDLLVVGARGAGALSEFLLGSVSRVCAREARCPVVIVHGLAQPPASGSASRIVVEVEKGRHDSVALSWATQEAVLRSSRVDTVFYGMTSSASRETAGYGDGSHFASRARSVSAVKALVDASQGADLLVIGAADLEENHERGVGSFLRRCVQLASCPVVVVGHSTAMATQTRDLEADT
jgi:nucleotide-binding universal stress UspA family protein